MIRKALQELFNDCPECSIEFLYTHFTLLQQVHEQERRTYDHHMTTSNNISNNNNNISNNHTPPYSKSTRVKDRKYLIISDIKERNIRNCVTCLLTADPTSNSFSSRTYKAFKCLCGDYSQSARENNYNQSDPEATRRPGCVPPTHEQEDHPEGVKSTPLHCHPPLHSNSVAHRDACYSLESDIVTQALTITAATLPPDNDIANTVLQVLSHRQGKISLGEFKSIVKVIRLPQHIWRCCERLFRLCRVDENGCATVNVSYTYTYNHTQQ
eukprot:GHVR01132506.1.p1 GENE.GHVR01132506.1~~GHVR01132506.1.p1  ORF type:complete len:269 (-),score=55.23 GHVR01132506.1:194-1000(-)